MGLPKKPFRTQPIWAFLLVLAAWGAAWNLGLRLSDLNESLPAAKSFSERFLHPDFSTLRHYLNPLGETVAIAVWATAIALIFGTLSTLFGARNLAPNTFAYRVTRSILSISRVLPDFILAIVFVAAFGPGPLAGVVTVAIGSFGQLGKMWCESLERVDNGVFEGLAAAGATRFQQLRFGGWPMTGREVWNQSLYVLDRGIREAVLIGVVGAGGIGMELQTCLKLFDFPRAAVIILMIVALILIVDGASNQIRKRLA